MKVRLSIYLKLLGLILALMAAVVGGLATYFTNQQINSISDQLHDKAATYALLSATQTRSAVAFDDRETAREVLQSLSSDSDIASATLFGSTGIELYTTPAASPWVRDSIGVDKLRSTQRGDRIVVAAPVVSLEGPQGTLVIELSRDKLDRARAKYLWLALIAGVGALLAGGLVAWLIARRLANRIRSIAATATAVAGGDLARSPVVDTTDDEIGLLATAFNQMLERLRNLIATIQEMARAEQTRLESLVAERTAQLDRRNSEMELVFAHVEQGLVMVDLDGTLADERSHALERWLGPIPAANTLPAWIAASAPAQAAWFTMAWGSLLDGMLPIEVVLDQIPKRLSIGGRELELGFTPVDDAGKARILVVVTDVTERERQARAECDEREAASLVVRLVRDRAGFAAFLDEAAQLVAVTGSPSPDDDYKRAVHTLKGICAIEDVGSIAELCHTLENALADNDETTTRRVATAVTERWSFVTRRVTPLLESSRDKLEVPAHALAALQHAIKIRAPYGQLATMIEEWTHESVARRLDRFADQARAIGSRTGKGALGVRVECSPDLVVVPGTWAPIWAAFSHAIRNAVDHGVVAATGDDLVLRAGVRDGNLSIEIEDHGPGVDWERVRSSANRHGLPCTTRQDLEAALFHDGLSTRDEVTEISGRGVGMAALREACMSMGGALSLQTSSAGTTIRLAWPWPPSTGLQLQVV